MLCVTKSKTSVRLTVVDCSYVVFCLVDNRWWFRATFSTPARNKQRSSKFRHYLCFLINVMGYIVGEGRKPDMQILSPSQTNV